jgi:5'-methylthioadenosine phosphorylase
VPGFDDAWRREALKVLAEGGSEIVGGGVYWQSRGPRLETPAEIRLVAAHADLIGMTLASESVVAGELGLPYAALCVVDNLANGIAGSELSLAELEANRTANREHLQALLAAALPALA